MSLYNDEYVNDVMTYFINGKEVTRDEAINSNSYLNVLKSKPHLIKTYNYRRANEDMKVVLELLYLRIKIL